MSKKKLTYIYELKDGQRIVYYGITRTPDKRFVTHKNSEKEFTHMRIIRRPMSRKKAEELETFYIQRYQQQHGGNPPKYNERKTYAPKRVESDFADFILGVEKQRRRTKWNSIGEFVLGKKKKRKRKSDEWSLF